MKCIFRKMSKSNKVYSCNYSTLVNAGNTFVSTLLLQSVGRQIKIKSISLDWQMINNTTGQYISPEQNTTQGLRLTIDPGTTKIASPFIVGANPPTTNGTQLIMYIPGQKQFDCFFIVDNINLTLQIDNVSAADNYLHDVCIIVETEEQTNFY